MGDNLVELVSRIRLSDVPPPTEGIHHSEPNTEVYIRETHLGTGTLYITESNVFWISTGGRGFSLEYPSIGMYGVAKDKSTFPVECILLMVTERIVNQLLPEEEEDAEETSDDETYSNEDIDEDQRMGDMRFAPANKEMLDVIFRALTDCQALNPEPNEFSDEDYIGESEDNGFEIPREISFNERGDAILLPLNGEDDDEEEQVEDQEMGDASQFEDADQD